MVPSGSWRSYRANGPAAAGKSPWRSFSGRPVRFSASNHLLRSSSALFSWTFGKKKHLRRTCGCRPNHDMRFWVIESRSYSPSAPSVWQVHWGDSSSCELKGPPILPQSSVSMQLDTACHATYDPGPPAVLRWSDGELWTRQSLETRGL